MQALQQAELRKQRIGQACQICGGGVTGRQALLGWWQHKVCLSQIRLVDSLSGIEFYPALSTLGELVDQNPFTYSEKSAMLWELSWLEEPA